MIRPTPRLLALAALGPPVAAGLVFVDDRLWVAAAGLVAAVLALAIWDARTGLRPSALQVRVEPPAALPVGLAGRRVEADASGGRSLGGDENAPAGATRREIEPEALRLIFHAPPGRAGPVIEGLLDVGDLLAPPPSLAFRLTPQRQAVVDVPLTPLRRGTARVDRLWLRWRGPLGLAWSGRVEELDLSIPAIPDIRGVRRAALALERRSALFGLKPQSTGGDGAEFDALRDYSPGMDRRAVDWKRTAKHRKLLVKEFQAERNHNIMIVVDSGHLMREPLQGAPKLDHAVNAGLMLAYQALVEGDRVGVFAFDAEVRLHHPPRPGKAAFPGIQKVFSELEFTTEETNFTLGLTRLSHELDRRSIVILITDFLDTVSAELMIDTLAHLAKRHLILFVALKDPGLEAAAFGQPGDADAVARAVAAAAVIRERRAVLARLRRLGVDALDIAPARLNATVLSQFMRAKRQDDPAAA
ncbi:MAG: DUF58 domain-containing protein [Pseudomonadota bacterium]